MIFIILLLITSFFIIAALTIIVWPHRRQLDWALPFSVVGISASIWLVGYALELASDLVAVKVFWAQVQYIGIALLPVGWFLFTRKYLHRERLFERRTIFFLLWLAPLLTIFFAFTNEFHNLIWQTITLVEGAPFSTLDLTYGTWFWIHTAYSYVLICSGTFYLVRAGFHFEPPYSYHQAILVVGGITPLIGNAIYLMGVSPVPTLDLTPQSFGISALLILFGVYRLDLLNIVPIARNLAVESVPDAILIVDNLNRILDVNEAMLAIVGQTRKQVLTRPLQAVWNENAALFDQYEAGSSVDDDITMDLHGEQRCFHLRIELLFNSREEVRGRLILLRDVTRRKRAEWQLVEKNESLQQREAHLRQATRASNIGTWEWHLGEQRIIWSQGMENVFQDAVPGTSFDFVTYQKHTHPDDWEQVQRAFRKAVLSGDNFTVQHRICRASGAIQWVTLQGSVIRNAAGQVERLTGVIRDVTAQKTAALALQQANEELSRSLSELVLLNSITQQISTKFDLDDLLHTVTRQLTEVFNNQRTTIFLLDESQHTLHVASDYMPQLQQPSKKSERVPLEQVPQKETILSLTAPRIVTQEECEQGAAICSFLEIHESTSLMSVPLRMHDQLVGIVFMAGWSDNQFTEQDAQLAQTIAGQVAAAVQNAQLFARTERARRIAEAANRAKSEFLAKVSHELRTPLGAILGYSEILQEGIYGPVTAKQQQTLEKIISSSHFLTRQVSELLDLSQLENGRLQLQRETFSPQELLDRMQVQLEVLARNKGLTLVIESHDLPEKLWGDPHRLQQILVNLIGNGIKFTDDGTVMVTAVYNQEKQLHIQISDTGRGIPPDMQDKIFDPFQQVDNSLAREFGGNGLGLSIVRELIHLMQGTLTLDSAIGHGTTFTIILPLQQKEEEYATALSG